MPTDIKEILGKKPFPNWMKDHSFFKETKCVKKIFPRIGLNNVEEDFYANNEDYIKQSAISLIGELQTRISKRIEGLEKFKSKNPKMSEKRKNSLDQYKTALSAVVQQMYSNKGSFVSFVDGKAKLVIPDDVVLNDKPFFKKGERLFSAYKKINSLLEKNKFVQLKNLDTISQFKQFSSDNIPNTKYRIVFASDGENGLWDIATMSMRGIMSCQSWDGDYRHCLIGSMMDPFVGIIYITSGTKFNEHGTKMIKRCMVRFVVNKKTKQPLLVLDTMYPSEDISIVNAFKSFIKQKTNNKFDVVYTPRVNNSFFENVYIPLTDVRKKLRETRQNDEDEDDEYYDDDPKGTLESYQDNPIQSLEKPNNDHLLLFEKNGKKKEQKFAELFSEAFVKAIEKCDTDDLNGAIKRAIDRMSGRGWNYSNMLGDICNLFSKEIIASVNMEDFFLSDDYYRKMYHTLFLHGEKIFDTSKSKLSKELNRYLDLKGKQKLNGNDLPSMMKILMPEINRILKPQYRSLIESKKKFAPSKIP